MSKFLTTSGAYMSVERTRTKVTVTVDHANAFERERLQRKEDRQGGLMESAS
jgi:hypothetical protein